MWIASLYISNIICPEHAFVAAIMVNNMTSICNALFFQTVEKNFVAGQDRFSLSGLATGKTYIVTLIAYRGLKRSKVVEIIFVTGKVAFILLILVVSCTNPLNR